VDTAFWAELEACCVWPKEEARGIEDGYVSKACSIVLLVALPAGGGTVG
jgi:hypothetical protein